MTWQAALILVLWTGWTGLHAWLGKRRFLSQLVVLLVLEVLAFAGVVFWLTRQPTDVSAGGAVALLVLVAGAVLLVPAAVGAFSLWKNGAERAH